MTKCKEKFRPKICLVLILCFGYACGGLDSPCPQIWTYTMVNNDLRGVVEVPSPNQNVLKLDVRLTVGNKVEGYNGQIQLFSSKEQSAKDFSEAKPIKYLVNFPFWFKYPPKVTRIQVNGESICYGPGLSLEQVPVLTTIDLEHTLTINSPPRRGSPPNGSSHPVHPSNDNAQTPVHHRLQDNVFLKDILESNSQNPTTATPPTDDPPLQPLPSHPNPPLYNQNNLPYHAKPPFTFPPSDFTTPPTPNRIPTIGNRQDFIPSGNPTDLSETTPSEGCGMIERNVVQLLAHAEPVVDVRYPWLVAIFIKSERSLNFACGGSLISYKHVISAAHCFPDNDPEMYQFVMSDNMRQLFSFENKTVREAIRVFRHPQYLPKSADADLAIAVLRTKVPNDRHIRPVCLWSEEIDIKLVVGKFGKVVGWGQDEKNQLAKKIPKEVNMPILDAAECVQSNALFSAFVSERSFCAGYKNGTGPCFGDSGSGFFMNRNGRYTLRGIVSITILDNVAECKISDYSALTDVTKFDEWIKTILAS